jgi:peptide/nickel transport system substrate-binding protein
MKRLIFSVWIIFFLSSCTQKEESLIIGVAGIPLTNSDPYLPSVKGSIYVLACIHDSLFTDAIWDGHLIPKISENVTVSENGIIVNIRRDVKFHDGSPLTAEHVLTTFEYAKENSQNIVFSTFATDVESIQLIDSWSMEIRFNQENSRDISILARSPIIKSITKPEMDEPQIIGCGQYILDRIENNQVRVRKNEHYYLKHKGPDTLIFRFYETTQDLLKAMITNEIDFTGYPWFSMEDVELIIRTNQYSAKEFVLPFCYLIMFNQKSSLFENAAIRQALSYACNRDELVEKALKNKGIVAHSPFYPIEKNINLNPALYTFSEKRAIELFVTVQSFEVMTGGKGGS